MIYSLLFFDNNPEHIISQTGAGIRVTSRIIRPLGNLYGLDLLVFRIDGETLATSNYTDGGRTGMCHLHIESLGESTGGIGHEGNEGAFDFLVSGPCLH